MTVAPLVVLVAGTGTEVGKTWVAARVAAGLRAAGCTVQARKPAQSFEPGSGPTDAEVLAGATGEDPAAVCPPHRWYEVPLAPPMAAEALGRPPASLADLAAELDPAAWAADVVLVEGAGGVRSPLAVDGDTAELAARLACDRVVLVADAELGTINAVRLSVAALVPRPVTVLLNRFDPTDALHTANRAWLADRDGLAVVVGPDELVAALVAEVRGKVAP